MDPTVKTAIPTSTEIILAVAHRMNIAPEGIASKRRFRELCDARYMVAHLIRTTNTRASLARIGSLLGGRDHTTIIACLGSHERLMQVDRGYRTAYIDVCQTLGVDG